MTDYTGINMYVCVCVCVWQLQQYERTLKNGQPPPDNVSPDFNNILDKLSSGSEDVKMNEIKSLITLSEAFMEFPQHIVKRAIELPDSKRRSLIDLVIQLALALLVMCFITSHTNV